MKNTFGCLKTTIATVVLTVGNSASCYGASINNVFSNILGEQAQGVQLINTTPEPETMLLFGIGLILLAAVSRKGKKKLNS